LSVAVICETSGEGVALQIVSGSGQLITGGTKSQSEKYNCVHSEKFPQSSVALHVNSKALRQSKSVMSVLTKVRTGVPQLSAMVISEAFGTGVVLQGRISGSGHSMNGSMSSKIEVYTWSHSEKFPQSSVAFHVKVVVVLQPVVDELVPTKTIVGVPQLSVAEINVASGFGVVLHGNLYGAGHVITGGIKSCIDVYTWLHSAKFPHASVALHVNV
jgi:hypothetical protein